jgi:3',5'-cyclic AMP phosphodiesterase CpdA
VLVLVAKGVRRRRGSAAFPENTTPTAIARTARIVLLADWGSGVPDAIKLAHHIRKEWVRKSATHVIHVGDVYYAGLPWEYEDRFLRHWPVGKPPQPPLAPKTAVLASRLDPAPYLEFLASRYPAPYQEKPHPLSSPRKPETWRIVSRFPTTSWCLAGNHDMFSGGHAFFDLLRSDPRFAKQGQSAYFLLENEDWQVFGLDTSFAAHGFRGDEGDLYGEQAVWVAQHRAVAPHKKCILLTHHQPFSAYDPPTERLRRQLAPVTNRGLVDAWFWGHEHRCALYEPHLNIRYPVLLGHAGFPERPKRQRANMPSVKWEWNAQDPNGFLLFGFAVLTLNGPTITVQLIDENNHPQHQFEIT